MDYLIKYFNYITRYSGHVFYLFDRRNNYSRGIVSSTSKLVYNEFLYCTITFHSREIFTVLPPCVNSTELAKNPVLSFVNNEVAYSL
jgi:hypothetical protein